MSMPRMLPACVRTSSAFGRELDAPGLAPPADLHLRLDDDGVPDPLGRGDRLVDGVDGSPADTGIP
ncbi:MAG: hypothetical protein KatS3mg010_1317 [Acidimicrobiia bacterium]|nr:MAG: hypothetical protein KatS3mg010_1317 [Acidimicrobiia bacterium]